MNEADMSGANMREVVLTKAYAVGANLRGEGGVPVRGWPGQLEAIPDVHYSTGTGICLPPPAPPRSPLPLHMPSSPNIHTYPHPLCRDEPQAPT